MKKNRLLCIAMVSVFLCNLYSQNEKLTITEMDMKANKITSPSNSETINGQVITVVSYKVVEKINMTFGGYTTTYVVSNLNLVNTYNLGPNNSRVVTPIYEKKRILNNKKVTPIDLLKPIQDSSDSNITADISITEQLKVIENLNPNNGVEYIDIIKTYERVYKKGYKSIEILKRLGDAYYFEEKLEKAAKLYEELFAMTTDLDAEYYFRYAYSLKFINKKDKSNAMMKIFIQKTEENQKTKN